MGYERESERIQPALDELLDAIEKFSNVMSERIKSDEKSNLHKQDCQETRSLLQNMELHLRTEWK